MDVYLVFFSGRGTLQNQGVESQLIQQWEIKEIIILIKPFPVESSLRMMWYVFVITFFCLIFLTSQSCENMLYDIVCLFHFRKS